ncbi:MAG: hypothetical protein HYU67_10795 [Flavobacteriia bacterium]|nr:hypothetical protein [Flavobacteriia bacterium]
MKKFNLNWKKVSMLVFTFTFISFEANTSTLTENEISLEKPYNLEVATNNEISNEIISIDGLFKRNNIKADKKPNYYKKSKKPSAISQYYLKNQSKSALRCIKISNKRHYNNKKFIRYSHKKHFKLFKSSRF